MLYIVEIIHNSLFFKKKKKQVYQQRDTKPT